MSRALVVLLGITTACGFSAKSAPGAANGSDAGSGELDAAIEPVVDAAIDAPATPSNARRKLISFSPGKVTGTQTDFPLWLDLVDTDIAARAQANGSDIYFTSSDGQTKYDHELQIADASNHRFAAWVRIPTLKQDTTLYVNYGDPGAAPAANPKGVFKSSFAAVWHLDDADPTKAIADATGTHAGTPRLTSATKSAPGQLGKGVAFNGTANERIEFTNPLTDNNPHTISVWVAQAANLTRTVAIVNMGTATQGKARWLHGHYGTGLGVGFYTDDVAPNPAVNIDGAGLTHLVWTFEGANKKNHLYRNGAEITGSPYMPSSPATSIATTGAGGYIGYAPAAYGQPNEYVGTIDELRIATVMRSNEWITTEYANQSSPAMFYTLGAELTP